jgi:hypothetical protein
VADVSLEAVTTALFVAALTNVKDFYLSAKIGKNNKIHTIICLPFNTVVMAM